ncbi:MAG: caspase family protein [Saprospirales bacterium]|nr:caspase family protein [Saprospirales bacterium]
MLERIFLGIALVVFLQTTSQSQPRKLALLIGIDNYPEASGMGPLQVCNGISLMRQTLLSQGFTEEDILELKNGEATVTAVREAFLGHLGQLNAGDIAFVHFTGHGLQIPDNDEDEPDGMDEALVLFDSRLNDNASLLRDDQMWALLEKLCEKAGPSGQVLVLIDACHAGGGQEARFLHRANIVNTPKFSG